MDWDGTLRNGMGEAMTNPSKIPGPYEIGSDTWPGLAKAIEETSELNQILAKIMASGGSTDYWDGTDLKQRLIEELGDTLAAIHFFMNANFSDADEMKVTTRHQTKWNKFWEWHKHHSAKLLAANQGWVKRPNDHPANPPTKNDTEIADEHLAAGEVRSAAEILDPNATCQHGKHFGGYYCEDCNP